MAIHTGLDSALISDVFLRQIGLGFQLQVEPLLVCIGLWRDKHSQARLERASVPDTSFRQA